MEIAVLWWAWLAIWLVWLGVWLGEWMVVSESIKNMAKRPDKANTTLVMTILFIALVESAAIYGLIIAFQLAAK